MKPVIDFLAQLKETDARVTGPKRRGKKSMAAYFRDWLMIRDQAADIVEFKLNKFQKKLLAIVVMMRAMGLPVRIVIDKSRKIGFSTEVAGILYYLAERQPNRRCLQLAHTDQSTKEIYEITKRFHDEFKGPRKRLEADKPKKRELVFAAPHKSSIEALTAGSKNVGRGGTPNYVHFSEVAFWPHDTDTWAAAETAVPKTNIVQDQMIIVESTPNGTGNVFHNLWQTAFKADSPYHLYKTLREWQRKKEFNHWVAVGFFWPDDERCRLPIQPDEEFVLDEKEKEYAEVCGLDMKQMKWARSVRISDYLGSWDDFNREYPANADIGFAFSGHPVYEHSILKVWLKKAEETTPEFTGRIEWEDSVLPRAKLIQDSAGKLRIWEHPRPECRYVLSADTSEGLGADYAEIIGMEVQTGRMVCYWHDNKTIPSLTGVILYQLGVYYNWALLIPERNNCGISTIGVLIDGHPDFPVMAEYPQVFFEMVKDKRTQTLERRIGWLTTQSSKQKAITNLQEAILKERITVPSPRIIRQLLGFQYDPEGRGTYKERYKDPFTGLYADDAETALHICETGRLSLLKTAATEIEHTPW